MKYKRKTEIVEAYHYDGDVINPPVWLAKALAEGELLYASDTLKSQLHLRSNGMVFSIEEGNYIVQHENGIIGQYRPEHFKEQFEPCEEPKPIYYFTIDRKQTSGRFTPGCSDYPPVEMPYMSLYTKPGENQPAIYLPTPLSLTLRQNGYRLYTTQDAGIAEYIECRTQFAFGAQCTKHELTDDYEYPLDLPNKKC